MLAVFAHYLSSPLERLRVLNVGGSAGAIDNFLADYFEHVVGVDIDAGAIEHARRHFSKENLDFFVADALALPFKQESFDVVVCSHVYEHVPDPVVMFADIHRVLKPGGICYFSAGNRLMWNEPHYNLPLLSVVPRPVAHVYIRLSGRAEYYHEKHLSYWGLRKLVHQFKVHDYTRHLIERPEEFETSYMVPPGSLKSKLAIALARIAYWAVPGYIWVLEKRPTEKAGSGSR